MEQYISRISIIVKTITKRYENSVDMPYEDLLQEGYIAAMNGVNRWHKEQSSAAIIAWAWIYILSRCKELSTSRYAQPEITSYEEHMDTNDINATDLYTNKYFIGEADTKIISEISQQKKGAFLLLKKSLSNGYSDIAQRFEDSISPGSIADKEHLTIQRINQLNKKIEDYLFVEEATTHEEMTTADNQN